MATDEIDRYHLYEWFSAHMGPELAPSMIASLPPVNWTEVATKDDLDLLRAAVDVKFADVRAEISASEARILCQNRTLFLGTLASNATLVGLVIAVLRFGSG